jgi:hypothetical protein
VLSSSGRAIGVRLVGCREEWDRVIRDKFIPFIFGGRMMSFLFFC